MLKKTGKDLKGFFFFVISLICLIILINILINEISTLQKHISHEKEAKEEQIIEKKEPQKEVFKTYTATAKTKESVKSTMVERKTAAQKVYYIRIGAFKNKENVDKMVAMLKKTHYKYKVKKKELIKIYVIAQSEKEKEEILNFLKDKKIKPVITKTME